MATCPSVAASCGGAEVADGRVTCIGGRWYDEGTCRAGDGHRRTPGREGKRDGDVTTRVQRRRLRDGAKVSGGLRKNPGLSTAARPRCMAISSTWGSACQAWWLGGGSGPCSCIRRARDAPDIPNPYRGLRTRTRACRLISGETPCAGRCDAGGERRLRRTPHRDVPAARVVLGIPLIPLVGCVFFVFNAGRWPGSSTSCGAA